jgi:hypothetical protein
MELQQAVVELQAAVRTEQARLAAAQVCCQKLELQVSQHEAVAAVMRQNNVELKRTVSELRQSAHANESRADAAESAVRELAVLRMHDREHLARLQHEALLSAASTAAANHANTRSRGAASPSPPAETCGSHTQTLSVDVFVTQEQQSSSVIMQAPLPSGVEALTSLWADDGLPLHSRSRSGRVPTLSTCSHELHIPTDTRFNEAAAVLQASAAALVLRLHPSRSLPPLQAAASADASSAAAAAAHLAHAHAVADVAGDALKRIKEEAAGEVSRAKHRAADDVRRVRVEAAVAVAAAIAKQQASAGEVQRLAALERELQRALVTLLAQSARATAGEMQAKADAAQLKAAGEGAAAQHALQLQRAKAAVEAAEKRAVAAELAADRVAQAAAAAASAAAATAAAASTGPPPELPSSAQQDAPPPPPSRMTLADSVDLFSNMNSSKAAASARLSARVTAAMLGDMLQQGDVLQQLRSDDRRLIGGGGTVARHE